MRECPKCKELNGESKTECWKCNTSLGPIDAYKKICTSCGIIYPQKADICNKCEKQLSVYSGGNDAYTAGSIDSQSNFGLYAASILIPILGIILGCIYIAKNDDELGKSLIITGIVSNIICGVLLFALVSCSAF